MTPSPSSRSVRGITQASSVDCRLLQSSPQLSGTPGIGPRRLDDRLDEAMVNPLRILHVAEAFGGGVFEVVRMLSQGTQTRGHRVAIAYGRRPETPDNLAALVGPNIDLLPTAWVTRSGSAQLRAAREIHTIAAGWRPDIVHLHSSFAGAVGVLVLRGTAPLVYSPHAYAFEMQSHSDFRRRAYRFIEARVARRVDVVGAVSDDEARLARDALGAPRVAVVANGIPELDQPVRPRQRTREPPLVVAMGRASPQRQPEACARILAELTDVAEVRWIGGAAVGTPGHEALTAASIPMTGWVSRSEALRQLAEATVYLHWTAWDGQPLSVLEAAARDVLVVAADRAPLRALLGGEHVRATEAGTVQLIRTALLHPRIRDTLLDNQRKRANAFGAERMVREWETLYQRLARRQSSVTADDLVVGP